MLLYNDRMMCITLKKKMIFHNRRMIDVVATRNNVFPWNLFLEYLGNNVTIQFLFPSLNMDSVFKFLQWSPNGSQFSFFSKNFTHNFFIYFQIVFKLSQVSSKHATLCAMILFSSSRHFCFHRLVNRLMRSKNHSKWKIEI